MVNNEDKVTNSSPRLSPEYFGAPMEEDEKSVPNAWEEENAEENGTEGEDGGEEGEELEEKEEGTAMVDDEDKVTLSSPKHNGAANSSQSEMTMSVPIAINVEETEGASDVIDNEKNAIEVVLIEENATVVMKHGENAVEEENDEETAMGEEEKHEESNVKEDERNERNALAEDYAEENAVEEEKNEETAVEEEEKHEESTVEEDERNEQNSLEEDYAKENGTEEADEAGEEGEEQEEKEEENEEKAIEPAKNEEKGESSKEKVKRSRKRGRKKNAARGLEEDDAEENGTEEDDDAGEEGEEEEEREEENGEKAIEIAKSEEIVVASSKEKTKRSRKRGRKKKKARVLEQDDAEENVTEEGKEEENEEKNEEKAIELAKNEQNVAANSNQKVKRSRKRGRKKKAALMDSERVASKLEDKPGSLNRKKMSKRTESMGMIFMCSSKTKKDCYRYNILGLPESKRDTVQKVYKGMRLFLFDIDLRLMYGIYKAAGPGGYNIEPNAFKSAFPAQVRFTVLEDCLPLPEEKFKKVIKDNYYKRNKFDCQLTSEQVKNLCKLFVAASKGSKSKTSGRNIRPETHSFVDRERIRRPRREEERGLPPKRYHDRPIRYERERLTYRVEHLPRLPPLPPPPAPPAPSYDASYGRTWERDVYGQGPLVERRDHQHFDSVLRRRDEIEARDPYVAYREPHSYRDPVYYAGLPPDYAPPVRLVAEYRRPAGPPPEHRHRPPEHRHRPHRPSYRY